MYIHDDQQIHRKELIISGKIRQTMTPLTGMPGKVSSAVNMFRNSCALSFVLDAFYPGRSSRLSRQFR